MAFFLEGACHQLHRPTHQVNTTDPSADTTYNPLWRKRCVVGCSAETPACPVCPDGMTCSLVPPSCEECQKTICVAGGSSSSSTPSSSKSASSGPNVGAIAGGVIGGLLVIATITYFTWRYCVKSKRPEYQPEVWTEDRSSTLPGEKTMGPRPDRPASTHTVGSIASTVLTRASNVIQIAYIPGVTNRGSAPSTPGLLVPPVPPIPIALSSTASTPNYEQEHFFMPGDLRDSTYSDRTSYARNSVASTIYGKNAIVSPVPAQTALRGKAAMVSVVKSGNGGSGENTPPVPAVDFDKYAMGPPSPAFSVGSTFLNNASSATLIKPSLVKVATAGVKKEDSGHLSPPGAFRDSATTTIIASPSPDQAQGPFRDPTPSPSSVSRASVHSLGAVTARSRLHAPIAELETPFGDENEISPKGSPRP